MEIVRQPLRRQLWWTEWAMWRRERKLAERRTEALIKYLRYAVQLYAVSLGFTHTLLTMHNSCVLSFFDGKLRNKHKWISAYRNASAGLDYTDRWNIWGFRYRPSWALQDRGNWSGRKYDNHESNRISMFFLFAQYIRWMHRLNALVYCFITSIEAPICGLCGYSISCVQCTVYTVHTTQYTLHINTSWVRGKVFYRSRRMSFEPKSCICFYVLNSILCIHLMWRN